uniref:Uncharacterized protein n=1 Tax=Lepeophtheirus salmonis TaxID=72036 RepID=A0A0K2UYG3_LEPSM
MEVIDKIYYGFNTVTEGLAGGL